MKMPWVTRRAHEEMVSKLEKDVAHLMDACANKDKYVRKMGESKDDLITRNAALVNTLAIRHEQVARMNERIEKMILEIDGMKYDANEEREGYESELSEILRRIDDLRGYVAGRMSTPAQTIPVRLVDGGRRGPLPDDDDGMEG